MIKVVKRLKFWSKKKKKSKAYLHDYPPSTCKCCYSASLNQPSAPPLPSWLEAEQIQETFSATQGISIPDSSYSQDISIVAENSALYPTLPAPTSSYQQYLDPNPVYGMPVVHTVRRGRSAGLFGCFVGFAINLIRCFCPCLHIQEVY